MMKGKEKNLLWWRACLLLLPALLIALANRGTVRADGRDDYFLSPAYATDSGAAATALATGHKTDGGNIAWAPGDPDGGALTTLAEQLRADAGFALGAVTTVPFNHATPASFFAHNKSRSNTAEIAHEIIADTVPEVVIGGGYNHTYFPLTNPDYLALAGGETAYTHVVTRTPGVDGGAALQAAAGTVSLAAGDRLFGLFGGTDGNFTLHEVADAPGDPAVSRGAIEDPLLAEATTTTLEVLSQDTDGFLAVIEQGDIDWSNHRNNFATMIGGIWDLERAVRAAETFVDAPGGPSWDDTLIIVTADHANSYLRLPQALGAGDLPRQINENGWSYPDGEVTYGTTGHTNELVTVHVRGQGANLFRETAGKWYPDTRIVDNTQIYTLLREAVATKGVRHLVLFVGDGMQLAHEVAGSRYLYGADLALAWHRWAQQDDGWQGFATTWDVTTYNKYAAAAGAPPYDPADFDPLLGYDGTRGGWAPYPLHIGTRPQTALEWQGGTLSWSPVVSECTYQVYRSTTPYTAYQFVAAYGNGASHDVSADLSEPGVNYSYFVDTAACGLTVTLPSRATGFFRYSLSTPADSLETGQLNLSCAKSTVMIC